MASCCERGLCLTKHAIFNDGEDFGFLYTAKNTIPNSNVNFLALDIPDNEELLQEISRFVMTILAHHAVSPGLKHGEICCGPTTAFALKKIDDPKDLITIHSRYMTATEPSTIFELVPLYPFKDPKQWGKLPQMYPGVTKNVQIATINILNKWRQGRHEIFLRHFPAPNGTVTMV
ncbi:MAG: hypothetical protein SGARI_004298, partial [Bacillariaceae sp.]